MRIRKDTDMTQGSIVMKLLGFAVPMMLGLLFQQFYSTVDAWVVGKFVSSEALAAVGTNGSVINTVVGTFAGLATGASVVISQAYGAHDDEKLSRAVHTTIALTFLLCLLGTAAGVLAAKPLLGLVNLEDKPEVKEMALEYLRIYFWGLSGLMVYNMGTGILRAVGDSTRPVVFLIISAVINTILDLVFVRLLEMEVAGVAYATIISQFISAILVLLTLMRAKGAYRLRLRQIRIHTDIVKRVLALGLPSSLQAAITSFSNVFVQGYINSTGTAGMAGWTAYSRLDAFLTVPVQAISMGSTTVVAQNWGAGLKRRARDGANKAILLSVSTTAVLSVLMILLAEPLVGLFVQDHEKDVIEFGVYFITIITPFYVLTCFNQIYSGALRGVGISVPPTVVMLSSFVVFRQIYLLIFSRWLFPTSRLVIALAFPMGWLLCTVLMTILFFRSQLGQAKFDEPRPQQ